MTKYQDILSQLLVIRAQSGDERAFHELVVTYSPRLRYYLRGVLKTDAVEDVLQEVWLVVFSEFGKLRSPSAFRAWLYQIARSRTCRELRAQAFKQIPYPLETLERATADDDWSADDADRIHVALRTLSDDHRDVLLLRFMESMSYEEIAIVLDLNAGTVRSRIHYAKRALRKKLEARDD